MGLVETRHLGECGAVEDTKTSPYARRSSQDLRERAVRMVQETIAERGDNQWVVSRIVRQLGVGHETLRRWVNLFFGYSTWADWPSRKLLRDEALGMQLSRSPPVPGATGPAGRTERW